MRIVKHMRIIKHMRTAVFCLISVRSCSRSKRSSHLPILPTPHSELSLGSYRRLGQRRLGRHSQFTALWCLLRADFATLGLQRCREPCRHKSILSASGNTEETANKAHQPNPNATAVDEAKKRARKSRNTGKKGGQNDPITA